MFFFLGSSLHGIGDWERLKKGSHFRDIQKREKIRGKLSKTRNGSANESSFSRMRLTRTGTQALQWSSTTRTLASPRILQGSSTRGNPGTHLRDDHLCSLCLWTPSLIVVYYSKWNSNVFEICSTWTSHKIRKNHSVGKNKKSFPGVCKGRKHRLR